MSAVQRTIRFRLNGEAVSAEVPMHWNLVELLQNRFGLFGARESCAQGLCGCCTVHIDGKATRSCITPISAVVGKQVTTIEHVATTPAGKKISDAWVELDVPQCGYCQAGQIMTASALLATTPKPSDAQIDQAMGGNLCRCATYVRIRAAIKKAAGPGEPVTQEIAVSVKGDKIECAINGTVVGSYDKATLVTAGKLKSTDGVYGIRFAHNTEGTVSGLTVTKP